MSRKQKDAAVAQSVVRRIGSAEVTGPIPVSSSAEKEWEPLKIKGSRFFYVLCKKVDQGRLNDRFQNR